jgi:hypothetical protein
MAVLNVPVVRLKSAACPSAVLPPAYPPSGGGFTASDFDATLRQASTSSVAVNVILGLFINDFLFLVFSPRAALSVIENQLWR